MYIYPIYAFLIVTAIGIIVFFKKRTKKTKIKDIFSIVFIMYCAFVVSVTLFPVYTGDQLEMIRPTGETLTIIESTNIVPFKTLFTASQTLFNILMESASISEFVQSGDFYIYIKNIVGNILLFIPLGFFLSILMKQARVTKITFIAFIFAASIELIQLGYNLYCGWPYRNANIDDVILNTLGAILGYMFYACIIKFKKLQGKEVLKF